MFHSEYFYLTRKSQYAEIFGMDTPIKTGRDPVCEAIETFLRELEADGKDKLEIDSNGAFVRLRFEELSVSAETLDIALVRLANQMMDDPTYALMMMNALRGQMQPASG